MSTDIYAIVFKGDIVEGFDLATVQAQVSALLKTDAKKTAALFSGKQIVLKKTTDKNEAAKYGKALKRVGADVKVRVIKDENAKPAPATAPPPLQFQKAEAPVFQPAEKPAFQKADSEPAAAKPTPKPAATATATATAKPNPAPVAKPAVDTSGLDLAPNEGFIIEPSPEAPPPDLDLSAMSLAENDGSPIIEPSEAIVVDLDLSEYSVAENDGRPLVDEVKKVVPVIEVPDFGLDEPGAVLDTIKEEKKLVNPDISGMSLATTGADLISDDERAPRPPPKAPDISKINLVPSFDS